MTRFGKRGLDRGILALQLELERQASRTPIGYHRDGRPILPIMGGSVANFIPTIWSGNLLLWLRRALVFAQPGVVNRDYEGEIAEKGNKVKIGMIGEVTVKTYVRNVDIDEAEELDVDDQDLEITEEDYFNFQVDDVDKRQTGLALVGSAMERAAYNLAFKADTFVREAMIAAGTPVTPSLGEHGEDPDAYTKIVDLGVALDDALIPAQGRFCIVPPSYHGLLRRDDRFVKYDSETDLKAQAISNAVIGQVAGMTIVKSVNTGGHVIAGSSIATTYADQISQVEAIRLQRRFADAVKGLHVYGAKVTRPEGIVYLNVGS